ncbi:MAG: CapA family protein [Halothiobacillaceae bacterium]|nr:MAG: CapA family protein [Halothiobacillaceae bacterium]
MSAQPASSARASITLFLTGDVMTGRGIDQILPSPSSLEIHEPAMASAEGYVRLAERLNGPIPRPVDPAYIWGDALEVLSNLRPDARIINLETAVTRADDWEPKGINYRMHPGNIDCLTAAGVDCCVLANNHVLDWGASGLVETLDTLRRAGMVTVGAGRNADEAAEPAILPAPHGGRVLVFAYGESSSGVPSSWAASGQRPGVNRLTDHSDETIADIARRVAQVRRPGDIAVFSIHWGGNWGYGIDDHRRDFAHRLIDRAGLDLVHGHSSHHPLGLEVYREKLILYGCGDLINDYEGIAGYEAYRAELSLLYFASLDPGSGRLARLRMAPMRMKRLQLHRAADEEVSWLHAMLVRESRLDGYAIRRLNDDVLELTPTPD